MKRIIINLIIYTLFSAGIYGQHQIIPNKTKATIWYDVEQQEDSASLVQLAKGVTRSNTHKSISMSQDSFRLLNFHKVKTFEQEKSSIKTPYNVKGFSRLTVIVVYHSPDTLKEHGIWSVHSGKGQVSGLTDRRLIRHKSEYVYPVKRRGIPLINTSMQSFPKNRVKADSNYFVMGETILPDSSLCYYSGDIAEYLVFDHFLKKTEALKIETYLAIKYGISLIASDYLSPSERILWSYEDNEEYSYGIAGIGKDSVSGLAQYQGSSSEEADLLTIGVGDFTALNKDNPATVPEGNYLVWGHNEGSLGHETTTICETEYPLWERKWMMQVSYTDTTKRFKTSVKIRIPEEYRDTNRLNYLVIDRSGGGDFTTSLIEYLPQSHFDTLGYAYFHNVIWDTDGSGKDLFSFSYGATIETMAEASCFNNNKGRLSVNMCGGKPPFHYLLKDSTGQQYTYQGGRNCIFTALPFGDYILVVTDSVNTVISKKIEIPVFDSAALELPSTYWLNSESSEIIDVRKYNSKSFTNYVWEKDGVLFGDSAVAVITLPGKYKLTVTDSNGCLYTSEMEVKTLTLYKNPSKEEKGTGLSYYKLYPNPTTGSYRVEVDLPEETAVRIRVFTVKGDLLEEWKDNGKKYYSFSSYLDVKGNYLIEVETIFGIEDFKLTVVR
ncbi:MAG: T9SS type A sorting domain-containing protein, partial [Bacteroidales bacterium]|jgi:hypothetical protein|nr:T9SS type A sorting domain-containing protein [Bacteroidales bacterium]